MFIRKNLKKIVSLGAGLVGMAAELIEAVIFSELAMGKIRADLFKPFGALLGVAALPGPCLANQEDGGEVALRILGYLPAAAANVAIFALESEAQAMVFTAAISAFGAITAVDFIYKGYKGELTKEAIFNFTVTAGKTASILFTVTFGGLGKVFELIRAGDPVPLPNQVSAFSVVSCAGVSCLYGLFSKIPRSVIEICKADSESAVIMQLREINNKLQQTDYHLLEEAPVPAEQEKKYISDGVRRVLGLGSRGL